MACPPIGHPTPQHQADPRLEALAFPLPHHPQVHTLDPALVLQEGSGVFGRGQHTTQASCWAPQTQIAVLQLDALKLFALRTTPCIVREHDEGFSTLALITAGEHIHYRSTGRSQQLLPASLFLNPRQGGAVNTGYMAGIFCQIEHRRLQRTLAQLRPQLNPAFDAPGC